MVLSIFQPFSLESAWIHFLSLLFGGNPERGASLKDQLSVCNEPWCKITERNIIIYAGLSEEHVASGWAPAVIASCSAPGTIPVLCLQNLPCSGPATSLISHLISIQLLIVGETRPTVSTILMSLPLIPSFFGFHSLFYMFVSCELWFWPLVEFVKWRCAKIPFVHFSECIYWVFRDVVCTLLIRGMLKQHANRNTIHLSCVMWSGAFWNYIFLTITVI